MDPQVLTTDSAARPEGVKVSSVRRSTAFDIGVQYVHRHPETMNENKHCVSWRREGLDGCQSLGRVL